MTSIPILCTALLVIDLILRSVNCCHSDSKELHMCLNIYLERDYPSVEAILKAQHQTWRQNGRGKALLEGPELSAICEQIESLQSCFANVAEECISYHLMYRFDRMMRSLLALYNLLCSNSRVGLKGLLTYAMCIQNVKQYATQCQDSRFDWDMIWKQMLRLQIGEEVCTPLDDQRRCMTIILQQNQCGKQAPFIYNQTVSIWLQAWCSTSCCSRISITLLLGALLFVWVRRLDF